MAIHLVTWDLIKDKDYAKLHKRIGEYNSCRPMLSVAIIKTDLTAVKLRDDLDKYIDGDDKLFIALMSNNWGTSFNNDCIQWMKAELSK